MNKIKVEVDGQHLELPIEEIAELERQRREAKNAVTKEAPEEADRKHAKEWSEGQGGYDDVSDHFRPEHR